MMINKGCLSIYENNTIDEIKRKLITRGSVYQRREIQYLQGKAILQFEDESRITLTKVGGINLPSFTRHKVSWTEAESETIWLAIHY